MLFGVVILSAIVRTLIRLQNKPRLALDDYLLLFSCLCLITSTTLLYKLVPAAYLFEELDFNPSIALPSNFTQLVVFNIKILDAYTFMSWVVIFAVKFCFLSFFRSLIDRVRRMVIYWRFIVGITAVFFGLSLCETFIACPRINALSCMSYYVLISYSKSLGRLIRSLALCLEGSGFTKTLAIAATTKCLDIITDILSMPPLYIFRGIDIEAFSHHNPCMPALEHQNQAPPQAWCRGVPLPQHFYDRTCNC